MTTEYFVDINTGDPWNGNTNYNLYNAQSAVGKASVSKYTQSITIYVDTNGTCTNYALYCMVGKVILSIGSYSKTLYSVWDACTGGCNNPFCQGNPSPITYQLDQNELSLAVQNGSVQLSISACGNTTYDGVMGLKPVATLTQEIPQQYSTGSVTVTVYLPDGSVASGASVILEDNTQNQQVGSGTTNSSGQVTFNNLTVGDSFTLTVSYDGLQQYQTSFDLENTQYSFAVTMKCPSGNVWQNGKCVPSGITADITTVLKYVAIAGGVILVGYAAVKLIPERKEEIVRYANTAKETAQNLYQRAKQRISGE